MPLRVSLRKKSSGLIGPRQIETVNCLTPVEPNHVISLFFVPFILLLLVRKRLSIIVNVCLVTASSICSIRSSNTLVKAYHYYIIMQFSIKRRKSERNITNFLSEILRHTNLDARCSCPINGHFHAQQSVTSHLLTFIHRCAIRDCNLYQWND